MGKLNQKTAADFEREELAYREFHLAAEDDCAHADPYDFCTCPFDSRASQTSIGPQHEEYCPRFAAGKA